MNNRTEQERSLEEFSRRIKIRANFDSYHEKTSIGKIYSELCKKTDISVKDVDDSIDELYNLLEDCGTSIENLETLADRSVKNRAYPSGFPNWNYLKSVLNSSANEGILLYITTYCNEIKEFLEVCNGKVEVCDAEWFETHVKFVKRILGRLETRRKNLQHREDNLEALNLKREQIRNKANEHFECGCGGSYTRCHKSQHEKTSFHQEWIKLGKPVRVLEKKTKEVEIEEPVENIVMCIEVSPTDIPICGISPKEDEKEDDDTDKEEEEEEPEPTSTPVQKKDTKEYLSAVINCGCGVSHSRANSTNHRKTKGHQFWEKNNQPQSQPQPNPSDVQGTKPEQVGQNIKCGCGGTYTKKNKATHCKTATHQKWDELQKKT